MKFILTCCLVVICSAFAKAQTSHPVISQIYTGGGKPNAAYTNDYIELYNPTSSSIDLSGWSVQYASKTGSNWLVTVLPSVAIQAGHYFLVKQASHGTAGQTLTADAVGTIQLDETNGKVALVNTTTPLTGVCPTTALVDLLGYGNGTNCYETQVAPSNSDNKKSLARMNNGRKDTHNNSADFEVATKANPRNTTSVALKLAVTAINPIIPKAGSPFKVVIEIRDANDLAIPAVATIAFRLATNGNAGQIGGTITGFIQQGNSSVTIDSTTLATQGTGVTVTALSTDNTLVSGTSNSFKVTQGAPGLGGPPSPQPIVYPNLWMPTPASTNDIYNTNSGNVGIGTQTPDVNAKLTVNGNIYSNGIVAIGPTIDWTKVSNYALAVNGTAIFTKIKVRTYPWADYVFASDYKLRPLKEVENYINKYHHLPGIQSANDVKENGVDVGNTQSDLLKKIEELTLYVIDLNKKVENLSKENKALKKQIKAR
jgi:hypothetical protein